MPHGHPKLTWKAFLHDLLRFLATLLGLLLVAGVLGYGVLTLLYMGSPGDSKQDTAILDLQSLQTALKRFHAKHQRFPSTQEGIQALVDDLGLERVPLDPWGNPFGYELREGRPVVWSHGADGVPGGEGEDADIISRDTR